MVKRKPVDSSGPSKSKLCRTRHQPRVRQTNMFQDIVNQEGLECFSSRARRREIRNQVHGFIRSGCGYRRLVEEVVTDIVAVYETIKTLETQHTPANSVREAVPSSASSSSISSDSDSGQSEDTPTAFRTATVTLSQGTGAAGYPAGVQCSRQPGVHNQMCIIILEMAAHVCQHYGLENADLVEHIISEHFLLQRNLKPWYDFLDPFGNDVGTSVSELYPFPCVRYGVVKSWITSKHLDALEYYIRSGRHLDLYVSHELFAVLPPAADTLTLDRIFGRVKFVDFPIQNFLFGCMTPLSMACLSANPKATRLLLRYGASYLHPYCLTDNPQQNWSQPLYILVNQLNLRQDGLVPADLTEMDEDDIEAAAQLDGLPDRGSLGNLADMRGRRLLLCLRLLCRAAPILPVRFADQITPGENQQPHGAGPRNIFLHTRFIPALPFLSMNSMGPVALEHLAKCAVRGHLGRLERLPDGIPKLPLPKLLKSYLDLEYC